MTITARNYQAKALDKIYSDLQIKQNVLLSGMMGCGKTFMSVRLIQRLFIEKPDMNFLVLMHKQELCEQFIKSFNKFTGISQSEIGICCAGLSSRTINKRVTVATVQTFVNIMDNYYGSGLTIIDEAHRIDINGDTQYKKVIDYLRLQRPECRILGLTATPARLGHGYIYGKRCKPGAINLFDDVSHKITYDELKKSNHLVALKGVVANHETLSSDLAAVSVSGDFVLNQLGDVMTRKRHLETAVEAIEKYCTDYKRICVFCCTIDHAEQLNNLLGDQSTTVHSNLSPIDRVINLKQWQGGFKRIITSVNILTEGFDMPLLDCLVFARPTLSSSLYLQAVGRVLRTAPGKDHCMLVDLTDNTARFGTDLDNVKITVPKAVEAAIGKERKIWKDCPECSVEVHVALRECPECGYTWESEECEVADALPDMKAVVFEKSPPKKYDVISFDAEIHFSKKSEKYLGKITYYFYQTAYKKTHVFMWLCFQDQYDGYAVEKSEERWESISNDPFPVSVDEFMNARLLKPISVTVDENEKYPQLIDVEVEKKAEMEPYEKRELSYNDPGEIEIQGDYNIDYDDSDIPF